MAKRLGNVKAETPVEMPVVDVPRRKPLVNITKILREQLAQIEPRSQRMYAELIVQRAIAEAVRGSAKYTQMILDRIDGKVPDRIAGPDGGPVQIDVFIAAAKLVYGQDNPEIQALEANFTEGE